MATELLDKMISVVILFINPMSFTKLHHFDLLFRRHRQELLVFAGQHSNNEIAEDLVQEAYLRFMQQAQIDNIENPRAFLYRVTRNLTTDYLRHGRIRAQHADDTEIELNDIADSQPGPDIATEAQLRLQRCLAALDTLPEAYRHVFLLHRIDGLTYAEIGQSLQLPVRTVERYAAKALAHCFAKAGSDLQK